MPNAGTVQFNCSLWLTRRFYGAGVCAQVVERAPRLRSRSLSTFHRRRCFPRLCPRLLAPLTHFPRGVGITGYRDDSLDTVKRNKEQYGMPLLILSYKDLYNWTMDEIVGAIGLKGNCALSAVVSRPFCLLLNKLPAVKTAQHCLPWARTYAPHIWSRYVLWSLPASSTRPWRVETQGGQGGHWTQRRRHGRDSFAQSCGPAVHR